jgi:protocatechuate 3,4-dioxygenase beta subunit
MDKHDDDRPVGRVLTRREMLALLGGAGAVLVAGSGFARLELSQLAATPTGTATSSPTGTALPSCVVRPALTEGPYFVDDMLNHSDIRVVSPDGSLKEGVPLALTFVVSDVSNPNVCAPIEGAQVDVWHCDALGVYSDVQDRAFDTTGQTWLRGHQRTDRDGVAAFTTIYPGWYSGRTVHIHFKIRTDPAFDQGYEFTSQLFFPEDLTDVVHAQAPYASRGYRDTLNADDGIFQGSEGLLTLDPVEDAEGSYAATFTIGLDLSQSAPAGPQGGFPGGPRPTRPGG